uniref:Uncharacterized protein n=1 Tax=Lactuca sativa TaxID=4236 RepID=A0A9R1WGU4_LACSA|nr:hypothetical protein LSAT_V11C100026730 [Lactuca sativa]
MYSDLVLKFSLMPAMSYSTSSKLQRRLHLTRENHIPIVGGVSSQRCYCSVATPEPKENCVWCQANRIYTPWELSWCNKKLGITTGTSFINV